MSTKTFQVLLVEDNLGDARLIQEALRETHGSTFEVHHADRLAAALEILAAGAIDVILLDLGLPDATGLDTLVRTHDASPGVPIVVLTSLDDEELALLAVREGAQDYLIKGLEVVPLVRAVRYAIERKHLEVELRQTQERLRTIIDNTPINLFATDPEGKLVVSEGHGLDAIGVLPGDVDGQSIFDLFAHQQDLIEVMRRALDGEEAVATVRANNRAYDLHLAPIIDETTGVRGIVGVSTDITDRVLAEEALRKSVEDLAAKNQELESFTYSVSHDLKEPLRTLEAFSQFLLEDYSEKVDEQGRDYLRRMGKASSRLKQMIEELLTLSRLGRKPEEAACVSVTTVVSNCIAAIDISIQERNARIEIIGELPDVAGDLVRVEEIFGNLIGNALKFNTATQPTIQIGTRDSRDGQAVIFVRDNGIGIGTEYHAQIFDVFARLHRREEYEGTGAGLAIVKRAVEAMGGSVWLESTLGQGTTFLIALPLWEDALVTA